MNKILPLNHNNQVNLAKVRDESVMDGLGGELILLGLIWNGSI